jgi:CDP-paratose 2-epimerase
VTGGAGFIGSNLADRLLGRGQQVTILDDCSRPGSQANVQWLRARHDSALSVITGDVRDRNAVTAVVDGADVVYHLAGQTAVTTSVDDPAGDFTANAAGTLNVLESARLSRAEPIVVYASTNKVYGDLAGADVVEETTRYAFRDLSHGVAESQPLEFNTPYACSKGAGDQYARAYHSTYGLRTVVLRQSCIYGPRQLGHEEQGWLAWFALALLRDLPLTIYGDGKQVRDLLYVDDLLDAYDRAVDAIDRTAGRAYNIGGGGEQSVSIWAELGPLLQRRTGTTTEPRFEPWRPGDQRVFISDTRAAATDFGWRPAIDVETGVDRMLAWVRELAAG